MTQHPTTTFYCLTLTLALSAFSGCGSSESTPSTAARTVTPPAVATTSPAVATDISGAEHTVSQFLDAVRRGGETGAAHSLLTTKACAVLERLGHSVQPFGTPAAKFVVTRSEAVAELPGSALVHSTWSEPAESGDVTTVEVVWALEWEQTAWKISGLAMELSPGQEPMIIDFEDYTDMANLFRDQTQPGEPAAVVATSAGEDSGNLSQPTDNLGRF